MGLHDIPSLSLTQFGEPFFDKVYANRIPVDGTLEITFRCNLRCTHCYCNLPANDARALNEELTSAEVKAILDQIADAGCLWLLITGGEPLVRGDFLDIYEYAKKKGFIIILFTNGTLITPRIADYLAEWPPYSVEISIYGVSPETCRRVTGHADAFKRCRRGIELLMDRKISLGMKTVVTTQNLHELPEIRDYAERLGLPFRFDPMLTARLDGRKTPCRFRLTPDEVLDLDIGDAKREKGWHEEFKKKEGNESDKLFLCGAGVLAFHIDPYGKMSICDMCRFHAYDLRSGSFREGWDRDIPALLETRRKTDSPCRTCPWTAQCSQCPGWSWVENGDLESPVDFSCEITRLRASVFGQEKINDNQKKLKMRR